MNRTILGTLILTLALAALAAGCAKTSCDELAESTSASADDADPGADDDLDPCGQCREHPGPQGSS